MESTGDDETAAGSAGTRVTSFEVAIIIFLPTGIWGGFGRAPARPASPIGPARSPEAAA